MESKYLTVFDVLRLILPWFQCILMYDFALFWPSVHDSWTRIRTFSVLTHTLPFNVKIRYFYQRTYTIMQLTWISCKDTRKGSSHISNHWSFPDKEGETFSMEVFHCFSTRSEAECGNCVENRNGKLFPWSIQKTEVGYRFIY